MFFAFRVFLSRDYPKQSHFFFFFQNCLPGVQVDMEQHEMSPIPNKGATLVVNEAATGSGENGTYSQSRSQQSEAAVDQTQVKVRMSLVPVAR